MHERAVPGAVLLRFVFVFRDMKTYFSGLARRVLALRKPDLREA